MSIMLLILFVIGGRGGHQFISIPEPYIEHGSSCNAKQDFIDGNRNILDDCYFICSYKEDSPLI